MISMEDAHRKLLQQLGDRVSGVIATPSSASNYEQIDVAISALEQVLAGNLDARREYVLRSIASEKCSGQWGYSDCLEADAMHRCPSCFVRNYLRTGEVALRATASLAAQCIAEAITTYQDVFKRAGRVDFTYWPTRNEVEVHVHADEDGETEPRTIYSLRYEK